MALVLPPATSRWPRENRIAGAITVALLMAIPAWAQFPGDTTSQRNTSFGDLPPRTIDRLPVFFPPNPPPLGRPPSRAEPSGGRLPAPPELAEYVNEFFYPALGTRLATKALSDKSRVQLSAYRAAKLALQNELRAELERIRPAEPAARQEALATLSRRQTPKLIELEKTAEQIRRDLVSSDNNWSAVRQWHLSDKQRRGYSPIEIAYVMRAYAFYDSHVLPAQRRLLREIAIELVFAAENTTAAAAAQPFMFFPPEPARVLLPEDLPPEVASKVAAYQTKKSILKKELYDAVQAADGATFTFIRGHPIKALVEKQAGRLKELETLAEEIRRGLGAMPPPKSERSPLPPHIDSRVSLMIANFVAAQTEAAGKIEAIILRAKDLPMQANYRFEGESLKFVVAPTRGARAPGAMQKVEAVRAEISAVVDGFGQRVAEILTERETIRQEVGAALSLTKPEDVERTLGAAMRIASQRQADTSFAEYRTAVFEPGLSPEQRRLLFDAVIERLALPLPRGELQPAQRAETW
jgi:hypothetical protein